VSGERSSKRSRVDSLRDAVRGIVWLVRSQRNARIHTVAMVVVVAVSIWLRITPVEWGLVLLCCGAVFAAEAFNSAIEELADEVSLEHRPRIGRAKDVAAAGVLLTALATVGVGVCVFGGRLVELFARSGG
jgi:diacylglycerol kinase